MRSLVAAAVAVTAVVASPVVARADSVQVLQGPGVTESTYLTYVGCDSFYGPSSAPQPRINLGPGAAPLGRRSVGLVPSAAGTASGPVIKLGSVATQPAAVSVHATQGTRGTAYAWLAAPDAPLGHAWAGRADLGVPAGSWQTVSAHRLSFHWQLVNLGTGQPAQDGGTASLGEFTARHGDGPGFVVLGFGCDGRAFNVDAVQGPGATIDYEGIPLTTSIGASVSEVGAGGKATVTGVVRNASGTATGDPLVLQARIPGSGEWRDVSGRTLASPDGVTRVQVTVQETTEYRWFRPEGQYADAGWSAGHVIAVRQAPSPSPSPTQTPSPKPTEEPTEKPTREPTPDPTQESSPSATPTPTPTPTETARTQTTTPVPAERTADAPAETASPAPSETTTQ